MSQPRQLLLGATYLVTRRTILQHMLLRPDDGLTQVLVYLLAVAARRYGVQVHAFCAMSTHIHLVVTDPERTISKFLHTFHRMVALCTNALRGWNAPLWDKSPTSLVRLETDAAVIEKIAYVIANPVAAGLVQHAREWPGAKVLVEQIGEGTLHASRPPVALKQKSPAWPAEAGIAVSLPPRVDPSRAATFRRQVTAEVERIEAKAHAAMQAEGRTFLGAEQACRVSPQARVTTPEPSLDRNPTFAVGHNQGDAWKRAAAGVRSFRASYHAALDLWRAGVRDVVFPAGTWLMRVLHGAQVADRAPDPAQVADPAPAQVAGPAAAQVADPAPAQVAGPAADPAAAQVADPAADPAAAQVRDPAADPAQVAEGADAHLHDGEVLPAADFAAPGSRCDGWGWDPRSRPGCSLAGAHTWRTSVVGDDGS